MGKRIDVSRFMSTINGNAIITDILTYIDEMGKDSKYTLIFKCNARIGDKYDCYIADEYGDYEKHALISIDKEICENNRKVLKNVVSSEIGDYIRVTGVQLDVVTGLITFEKYVLVIHNQYDNLQFLV